MDGPQTEAEQRCGRLQSTRPLIDLPLRRRGTRRPGPRERLAHVPDHPRAEPARKPDHGRRRSERRAEVRQFGWPCPIRGPLNLDAASS